MLSFAGYGYTGHDKAKNVSFASRARVHYDTKIHTKTGIAYVTFRPLAAPQVEFQPIRIQGFWASFFQGVTMSKGHRLMRAKLAKGFTVAMSTTMERKFFVGVGLPRDLPQKPFDSPTGQRTLINEHIRIHEDGRDFLGPFTVQAGETITVHAQTRDRWGFDAYLVTDSDARGELATYVDPRNYPDQDRVGLAQHDGSLRWTTSWTASQKTLVWALFDNTDQGYASPPSNMVNDKLDLVVHVGVK